MFYNDIMAQRYGIKGQFILDLDAEITAFGSTTKVADLISQLALIQCTFNEMAVILKVSRQLLDKIYREGCAEPAEGEEDTRSERAIRFKEIIDNGRIKGAVSLRRQLFKAAVEDGNIQAMIWLSKQYLGFGENVRINGSEDGRELFSAEVAAKIIREAKEYSQKQYSASPYKQIGKA